MYLYLDAEANETMAIGVVVDAKINYPSACNAAETLLLHRLFFFTYALLAVVYVSHVEDRFF
jgi:glutamate-5-semialdehyde dehydrogenase